ncbi:MAG: CRP/FNR family cyclic AMP-dependent transcriptional regulator [Bacteroidia bacterium]
MQRNSKLRRFRNIKFGCQRIHRIKVKEELYKLDVFDGLPEAEFQLLGSLSNIKTIRKSNFIYQPGDVADKVFFVLDGMVKTGTYNEEGKEAIKHIICKSEMFGELGLSGVDERSDFAATLKKEATVLFLPVSEMKRAMSRNPELGLNLINKLGNRIKQSEKRLEELIFKDSRARIISFIRTQADKTGQNYGDEVLIKHGLTQQDMANLTGTSRQLVTIILNELRKEDQINFDRSSILIRDLASLQ